MVVVYDVIFNDPRNVGLKMDPGCQILGLCVQYLRNHQLKECRTHTPLNVCNANVIDAVGVRARRVGGVVVEDDIC